MIFLYYIDIDKRLIFYWRSMEKEDVAQTIILYYKIPKITRYLKRKRKGGMVVIWKSGKGSIWGRVYYTAVMLALSVTIWQLNHWNLLGFHY